MPKAKVKAHKNGAKFSFFDRSRETNFLSVTVPKEARGSDQTSKTILEGLERRDFEMKDRQKKIYPAGRASRKVWMSV